MKQFLLLIAIFIFSFNQVNAQLVANAGPDFVVCQGASFTIGGSPTASGGTPPYNYAWSAQVTGNFNAALANPVVSYLGMHTVRYVVLVTDNLGQQARDTAFVSRYDDVIISTNVSDSIVCVGDTLSFTATFSGGTPPYAFEWRFQDDSNTIVPSLNAQLAATRARFWQPYFVVTDSTGCEVWSAPYDNFNNIYNAPGIIVLQNCGAFNLSTTNACGGNCNGAAAISPAGGYLYEWHDANMSYNNFTPNPTDFCPGTYTVLMMDSAFRPIDWFKFNINNVAQCNLFSISRGNTSCTNTCNGSATVTPAGNYRYLWSNSATTATISNLCVGNYSVTVMDSVFTPLDTLTVNIISAASLFATVNNVPCFGGNNGSANVSATGFTGAVSYLWTGGMNGPFVTGLAAGTYSVTVTDAALCSVSTSVNVFQPGQITAMTSTTSSTCGLTNGTIVLSVQGGAPPYNHMWSDGGMGSIRTSLPGGSYSVTVTDGNGCTASAFATVNQSSLVVLSINATDASGCGACDGSVTGVVIQGVGPYNYFWSNGATTGTISNLCPGVYRCTITDNAGCLDTAFAVVNAAGSTLNVTTTVNTQVTCTNPFGSITANVLGGIPPLAYVWSNGDTTAATSGLTPGTYSVSVTDSSGCSGFAIGTIRNQQSFTYHVYASGSSANCGTNGTASVSATGGRAPYTYLWNSVPPQTTQTATALSPGAYSVTVTDSVGCQRIGTTNVLTSCKNIIRGRLINDTNGNCLLDSGETPLSGRSVIADGVTDYYGYTNGQGYYSIPVPAGTYNIRPYHTGVCLINCPGLNTSYTHTFPTLGDTLSNRDFYMTPAPFNLRVSNGWAGFRPGFTQTISINYANVGTDTVDATLTFAYDADLVYQSSTGNGVHNATNHTITWTLTDIIPRSSYNPTPFFTATFLIPIGTPLNTPIVNGTHISSTSSECDTSDNVYIVSTTVRNSYDPNDKAVSPSGDIFEEDSMLTYTIRFQNTGNDTAWFVILKDTLSSYLEPGSVENLASSHPITEFRIEEEGILTWVFNPIYLVDSFTNEPASHGYVIFRVKKRSGLPLSTVISNTAHIYFDYNEPVATNTITNTLTEPNFVFTVRGDENISVMAMPNPFTQQTQIVVTGINSAFDFELFDVTGKVMKKISSITENRFALEREDMSAGVYFYRITTTQKQRAFGRVVVE